MKLIPVIMYAVIGLSITSCSHYNYVSNLPATPCFEEAGEIQGRIGVGAAHTEFQVAASPFRYFGMTYTQFDGIKANNGTTRVQNLNFHLYHDLVPQTLFLDLSYGFGKGSVLTEKFEMPDAIQLKHAHFYSSFSKQEIGLNLYGRLGKERNIQVGFGAFYRSVLFNRLGRRYTTNSHSNITTIELTNPQERRFLSQFLCVKITPENAPYLSFSQTINIDYALGKTYFDGVLTNTTAGGSTNPKSNLVYFKSINSSVLYAVTVGVNLNVYKEVKKHFHK